MDLPIYFADRLNSNLFAFCAVNQETSQKQFPVRFNDCPIHKEIIRVFNLSFVSISERLTYLLILLWYTISVLYKAQQSSLYIYVVEKRKKTKIKYIFLRGVLCLI